MVVFSAIHLTGLVPQRAPSEAGQYLLTIQTLRTEFSSGVRTPRSISMLKDVLRLANITSFPLTGHIFGGQVPGFDTRSRILPGAWSILEEDFARHPPAYIVDSEADSKTAQHPVKDFPILANLLKQQYQVVARTSEGVIYRML